MTKVHRWMSRGMPGEASVRVIVSVIIVASVFALVSLGTLQFGRVAAGDQERDIVKR